MNAVVLAAGFGRRLHPLTEETPKALLTVGGTTLLGMVIRKLIASGFDRIVVNAHHHADRIEDHLRGATFGTEVLLSREEEILGTGGGVKRAASLLGGKDPLLVHNVDVLSDLPLAEIVEAHRRSGARATLAVMDRPTKRALAVDEEGRVRGRWGEPPVSPPRGETRPLAFNGIQVVDASFVEDLPGEGSFDLIDAYLARAAEGEEIGTHPMDGRYWADMGTPERFARAEADLAKGKITLEELMGAGG